MLPLLSFAKLVEDTQNSGYLLRGKPQCSVVVEALDPSQIAPTSIQT